jgi:hypothetical protein
LYLYNKAESSITLDVIVFKRWQALLPSQINRLRAVAKKKGEMMERQQSVKEKKCGVV